jgi:exosortase/archaeosortase family protein
MITLLVANYFWKFTMNGDEDGEMVTWFGLNITAPFDMMSRHIASVVYWLVDLFRDTVTMVGDYTIRFDSGSGTKIVWGCSGLKQSFIWMMLILTVMKVRKTDSGKALWIKKLWYIPLGWACCYVFNILRIFLIAILIEHHPEWFDVLHEYIFKYLFYAMLFGLWVIFVEKIRPSSSAS